MKHEKVIVELLERVRTLEEQVADLLKARETKEETEVSKITTEDIRQYILELKEAAREARQKWVTLRAGDIHKTLGLKRAMPQVCNAMRQCMEPSDVVVHTTPSGNSSTIEIKYKV